MQRAPDDIRFLSASGVLQLQRQVGNRALSRVMHSGTCPSGHPELTVGAAGDECELEADRVARQVLSQLDRQTSRVALGAGADGIHRSARQAAPEASLAGGDVAPEIARAIESQRGGGAALPDPVRAPLEQAFDTDFSGVRVHTDSQADALNRSVDARAFTTGQAIFFQQGAYEPSSREGQALLAHELTHVVQQGAAPPRSRRQTPALEARLPSAQQSRDSGITLGQAPQIIQRSPQGRIHRCGPSLDDAINKGRTNSPERIAQQLAASSPAFASLRGTADASVKKTYGEGRRVEYLPKPKVGAGTGPAYYTEGRTYYDQKAPVPATVLNIVFETANAAQAAKFKRVEDDFNNGVLKNARIDDYVDDVSALGDLAASATTLPSKRSLIQEYYEWHSCLIAKNALLEVAPQFTSPQATVAWDVSFQKLLQFTTFAEYYEFYGKIHRAAVQGTLEASGHKASGAGQVNIDKLFNI